jgi:hypothetical protein
MRIDLPNFYDKLIIIRVFSDAVLNAISNGGFEIEID